MNQHSVEKIGGTSMSDYAAVRDNIVINGREGAALYQRSFVVSAYGGLTNQLLEHKKTGEPGVYALFANAEERDAWDKALTQVCANMCAKNAELFSDAALLAEADAFISERIEGVRNCLNDLKRLCSYGQFHLDDHLLTVREMLASIGEAHSAYNMASLLRSEGVNARFLDLTGWREGQALPLEEKIRTAFTDVDFSKELPIITGYAYCSEGLMRTFDRGYSEITFSKIAEVTFAREAIIHKEFHLSSADPRVVGEDKVVPIGRTNYDVADQLANLGMEAIHPKAAKGLRQKKIPLRVKNTFEPDHTGTLIDSDYVSSTPCVEIIAGMPHVFAIEVFDQEMLGDRSYERFILDTLERFKVKVVTKDINANTITHYVDAGLKNVERVVKVLKERFATAEISVQKVAIVSAIGSYMKIPGMLAKTVKALADSDISVLAMHQSMRQVDMQFVVEHERYEEAIRSLHSVLIEPHNHKYAICAA